MVRVTVPATSANMGSGYDSIGIALEMYNVIDLAENDHIDISDKNGQFVPKDESNLIYQCAKRVYDECGKPLSGLTIVEDCAIPQTRGLGSSSACTVAGIMGANALLGEPLDRNAVIDLAATIEGHPDNSTPAILGGFCVALLENGHVHHVRVPVHGAIDFVVFIPDFQLSTEKARAALPKRIDHHDAVYNLARAALLAGSLTSTPAFSATKEAVAAQYQDAVTVGYGIAYLFGVIGVVLFVQLMPRVVHADLDEERRKITHVETGDVAKFKGKLLEFDDFGFTPFAIAAVFGILLGSVKFFNFFSLTTTGGALLVSLVFGHFGHIGRADLMPSKKVLETFRELGLMVFLIGAGVSGGMSFVRYFKPIYFVYGIFMTLLPMVVGYIVAKHVLKMNLLNILGSITGGMTSTPALGTLIHVAGTSNVASAYAATYPIALIAVVLVSQLLVRLF